MTSICFLAQFPPPMHGLSKAIQTLFNSWLKGKYSFTKIDITHNSRIVKTLIDLLKTNADIIYFTPSQTRGGNLRDLLFLWLIRLRHKPCIAHIHGGYFRILIEKDLPSWQRKMNYKAVSNLAGGIVLGNSLRSIFDGMLTEDKIFVCPNCVDDDFLPRSINDKINLLREARVLHVLYLSNFIETKGYLDVLHLAEMVNNHGQQNKFVFHFAGKFFSTEDERHFRNRIKGLNNVKYHGIVGGKDKTDLLQQCNIFTLLSRYPNEGQPISILEAMGNGMAIITTNHAGIPEIANAGNGLVCDKGNIKLDVIYNYLLDSYNNRNQLIEVCQHNYHITKTRFTEKQYIDNMDTIFETVCNRIK